MCEKVTKSKEILTNIIQNDTESEQNDENMTKEVRISNNPSV